MSADPLIAFLARTLRTEVRAAHSTQLGEVDGVEHERIHYSSENGDGVLVMRRLPREEPLEAQLLPFLARKTDRVPRVLARGIPPPAANARSWVLIEDLLDAPSACDDDAREIVAALAAVEAAVARDAPALRALGVPERSPAAIASAAGEMDRTAAAALASWPLVLAHGDLRCGRAVRTDRGVVLVDWRRAALSCGLVDVARLALDAGADARALVRGYGDRIGRTVSDVEIAAALRLAGVSKRGPAT